MAFLTFILLAFSTAVSAADSSAALPRLAAGVLAKGHLGHGKLLARALEKRSPEQATVYRLAWIGRLHGVILPNLPVTAAADDARAWPASSEIWRDEWSAYEKLPQLPPSAESFVATDAEQDVIESLVAQFRDREHSSPLEEISTISAYNEWQRGKRAEFTPSEFETDRCQWRAARLEPTDHAGLKSWDRDCAECAGAFCAVARVKVADVLAEEGSYARPLKIYTDLARQMSPTPLGIQYRMAALQILTGQPLVNSLRAAAPLFDERSKLPEIQKQAVRSHLCDSLARLPPAALKATLGKVFEKEIWVRQARSWVLSCPESEAIKIARLKDDRTLSAVERGSLDAALKLKRAQAKTLKMTARPQSLGGLKVRARKLTGVLDVPVLLPFPEISWPRAAYRLTDSFARTLSANP